MQPMPLQKNPTLQKIQPYPVKNPAMPCKIEGDFSHEDEVCRGVEFGYKKEEEIEGIASNREEICWAAMEKKETEQSKWPKASEGEREIEKERERAGREEGSNQQWQKWPKAAAMEVAGRCDRVGAAASRSGWWLRSSRWRPMEA